MTDLFTLSAATQHFSYFVIRSTNQNNFPEVKLNSDTKYCVFCDKQSKKYK